MNIFKKFKVTFNLKNPKVNRSRDNRETEVKCLKYKVVSEFTEQQVFNTNPRHFSDKPFTPKQPEKLNKSPSENDLYWQRLATTSAEQPKEEWRGSVEPKNVIWPSENEMRTEQKPAEVKEIEEAIGKKNKKIDINEPIKERREKGILKKSTTDTDIARQVHYSDTDTAIPNFVYESEEENSYEGYQNIDYDIADKEEEVIYFDQSEEDKGAYVVHRTRDKVERKNSQDEQEYEQPIYRVDNTYNRPTSENNEESNKPSYNILTHPKLNATAASFEMENLAGLNSFGNKKKLEYPGDYSSQAANIFFDDDEEDQDHYGPVVFGDNISEMSA